MSKVYKAKIRIDDPDLLNFTIEKFKKIGYSISRVDKGAVFLWIVNPDRLNRELYGTPDIGRSIDYEVEKILSLPLDWDQVFNVILNEVREKPIEIGENKVVFEEHGIRVGCQFVSKEIVNEIYKRLNKQ